MPWAPVLPQRASGPLPEPVVWSEPCPCPVLLTHWKSLDRSWYQPHMPLSKLQDSSGQREVTVWRWKGIRHHKIKWIPQMSLCPHCPSPLPKFTPHRGPRQGRIYAGPWPSVSSTTILLLDRVTATRQPPWKECGVTLPAHVPLAVPAAVGDTTSR